MISKKFLAIAIFFLGIALISHNAFSQNTNKNQKTPQEFATKVADRMKKNLSLSDEQYKQVYSLALTNAQDRLNNREKYKNMDKTARQQMMKQNRESYKTQLQGILSKEQFEKLQENMHKNKNKIKKQMDQQK